MDRKKIITFIVILVILILLFNVLFRLVIPIKPVKIISKNMEPAYMKNDVLFYSVEENYNVGEVIILESSELTIVTRLTDINQDGTYEASADNNLGRQLPMEREIQKSRIKGRVIYSTSPYIFYILSWGIQIIIALLLTTPIYSRIKKK